MGRKPSQERYFARYAGSNLIRYYRTQTGLAELLACFYDDSKWQLTGWTLEAALMRVKAGEWWELTEAECPRSQHAIEAMAQDFINRRQSGP